VTGGNTDFAMRIPPARMATFDPRQEDAVCRIAWGVGRQGRFSAPPSASP
jgi:hypothetical protein